MRMRTPVALGAVSLAMVGALLASPALSLGHHPAQAARSSREHFLGLSTNPAKNGASVIVATGPIHAQGRDKVISGRKDRFIFPDGSITVVHHRTSRHGTSDKKTCYFTQIEHGTYKVTSGTGSYAGAHGAGKYVVRVQLVACAKQKPKVFMLQINARGPLTL